MCSMRQSKSFEELSKLIINYLQNEPSPYSIKERLTALIEDKKHRAFMSLFETLGIDELNSCKSILDELGNDASDKVEFKQTIEISRAENVTARRVKKAKNQIIKEK